MFALHWKQSLIHDAVHRTDGRLQHTLLRHDRTHSCRIRIKPDRMTKTLHRVGCAHGRSKQAGVVETSIRHRHMIVSRALPLRGNANAPRRNLRQKQCGTVQSTTGACMIPAEEIPTHRRLLMVTSGLGILAMKWRGMVKIRGCS